MTRLSNNRPLTAYVRKLFQLRTWYLLRYRIVHRIVPYSFWDDKAYIAYKYLEKFGYPINLKHPQTFNDKLNWLKLYNRNPLYTQLSDKFLVRDYVSQKIGPQYLNKLLGVFNAPEEIDYSSLPDQFVLKVTQGCKFNIINKDAGQLNVEKAQRKLAEWLRVNHYTHAREWPYKDIQPLIICEAYLPGDPDLGLLDYKFFCFNGEPVYVAVDFDRFTYHTQFFYNLAWERQPFVQGFPMPDRDASRPSELDEMVYVARKLSTGIPFCRIDLYNFSHTVLFGEITFYPHGGFQKVLPIKYELELGKLIRLPEKFNVN